MTTVEWLQETASRRELTYGDWQQAKEMEKERILKMCYGVWRAAKSGANYIYITKDSDLLGYAEPLSEEDRLKIDVELFIKIEE